MKPPKAKIRLVIERFDGYCSDAEITGDSVTSAILEAAEDLLTTLTCGERALSKNLYDACATAFNTTRDDAKKRLIAAIYGSKNTANEPMLLGWTWRAHLDDLHVDVRAKRWLRVSKTLALMLRYAIDELREKEVTP